MARKTYFLGDQHFDTKASLEEYLRNLWNNSPLNIPLDDAAAMVVGDLLLSHPRVEEKIGCGIDYLYVGKSPNGNNNCFHIMRACGSFTDFGTQKCFKGDNKVAMFKSACRSAVKDQIDTFRTEFFATADGKAMKDSGEVVHVDHVSPTFDHIVGIFFRNLNLQLDQIDFDDVDSDNKSGVDFKNKAILKDFSDFHRRNANLEGVTKRQNLSDSKKGVKKTKVTEEFSVYVKPEEWASLNLT